MGRTYLYLVGHDKFQNEITIAVESIESMEEDAGGSFITTKSGRNISLIEPPAELMLRTISTPQELQQPSNRPTPPEE